MTGADKLVFALLKQLPGISELRRLVAVSKLHFQMYNVMYTLLTIAVIQF